MSLFKNKFRIESIRIPEYDYSNPNWYYVTINTREHHYFFGDIVNGEMILNEIGKTAKKHWEEIPDHYKNVGLDYFIIMPNHIHGIIIINDVETPYMASHIQVNNKSTEKNNINDNICTSKETGYIPSIRKPSLSVIIATYKAAVKRWCNKNNYSQFTWQPRFYEHIIRNEKELFEIRKYISENPLKWEIEKHTTENIFE